MGGLIIKLVCPVSNMRSDQKGNNWVRTDKRFLIFSQGYFCQTFTSGHVAINRLPYSVKGKYLCYYYNNIIFIIRSCVQCSNPLYSPHAL